MGARSPLGYDRPKPGSRALIVNETEAERVRLIFRTYLDLGSVHDLVRWLDERDIRSKKWVSRSGKVIGGAAFGRGALFHLLRNRTYLGCICHKEEVHPGQHEAIVDEDLFDAVQKRLDAQTRRHAQSRADKSKAPLTGRIFDADGQTMSPTFSYGKCGKPYRYYVSAPLVRGQRRKSDDETVRRVPARLLETLLSETIKRLLPSNSGKPFEVLKRVEVHNTCLQILMPGHHPGTIKKRLAANTHVQQDFLNPSLIRLTIPATFQKRGGHTQIIGSNSDNQKRSNPKLIKALRTAHAMVDWKTGGLPQLQQTPTAFYKRRLVRLAFLAPDLQNAILEGRQPPRLTLKTLLDSEIPLDWDEQRQQFFENA